MEAAGDGFQLTIDLALCNGVACRRCERACSQKGFNLVTIITTGKKG
jgi:NAD-dependent dihydropyrimidine dehydrogenase PreA subunit